MKKDVLEEVFNYLINDPDTCLSRNYAINEVGVISQPYNKHIPLFTFDNINEDELEVLKDACESDIRAEYLGLCGCFAPQLGIVAAVKILGLFALKDKYRLGSDIYKIKEKEYLDKYFNGAGRDRIFDDEYRAFSLYQLDTLGLIDHGFSIINSWLTDKGKIVLKFYEDDIDTIIAELEDL